MQSIVTKNERMTFKILLIEDETHVRVDVDVDDDDDVAVDDDQQFI